MRLSSLQKLILEKCLEGKSGTQSKSRFFVFYPAEELNNNRKIIQDTVHKSLESLVAKDLIVAYGKKTSAKWFINRVKLTAQGKKKAREIIFAKQRKLPKI